MKKIWDYYCSILPEGVTNLLENKLKECNDPDINNCFQQAAFLTLKDLISKKDLSIDTKLNVALLTLILTHKMKAQSELISSLFSLNHPFTSIYAYYYKENPSNYSKTIKKIEKEKENLTSGKYKYSIQEKALILSVESWIYGQEGNIKKLKEIDRKASKIIKEYDDVVTQFGLQETLLNIAWWYLHSGTEAVKELLNFIEPYILKYKFYKTYSTFLNVKGSMESFMGNNPNAMKYFQKLVDLHSQHNDNYRLSIALGNLSEVYVALGDIIKAKDMMEKAIKLYKESTDKWPYLYLAEIGNIYSILNDKRAEESFLQAYEIQKKDKSMHKAFIMYELIHYYLRTEQLEKAKRYLNEFKELTKELETPSINARFDYIQGFYEILRYNFANGIAYLQSALEKAQITRDMEILQYTNVQLASAYLLYYKFSENLEHVNKAMTYIETVRELALENKHSQILVLAKIIGAIIIAITGDLNSALNELESLKENKNEIDLSYYIDDINLIKQSILNAKSSGEIKLPLNKALNFIIPQFQKILNFKLLETKKKEVQTLGVLVISDSGIPVFTKLSDSLKADDLLLSGLLMAINQLANSIIKGQHTGRLKNVSYADFSITLQAIKNGMIAIITTEITAEVRIMAMALAERIKEIPGAVNEFVTSIQPKIEDLLYQMKLN